MKNVMGAINQSLGARVNAMKKLILRMLFLVLVAIPGQAYAELPMPCQIMSSHINPFEKIKENNGVVTVQFPNTGGRWRVIIKSQGIDRVTEYGESFQLRLKEKMELIERNARLNVAPIEEDNQMVLLMAQIVRTREGDKEHLSCFMPVNKQDSKEVGENSFIVPSKENIFTIVIQESSADLFTPETLMQNLPKYRVGRYQDTGMKVGDDRVWQTGVIVLKDKKVLFWATDRERFIRISDDGNDVYLIRDDIAP